MCPVETEAVFQSSLGPFTVNKHKRASREGRRTGSHLINLQTRSQIREAHAFITVEVLGMSPFNLERLFMDLQDTRKSLDHSSISARIIPGKCQHGGMPIASCRVCNLNLDVITACVHFQMEE